MRPGPALTTLLRQLREQENQSLRKAASDMKLAPSYLSRIERGEKPVSAEVRKRAAEHYGVSEERLALAAGQLPDDVQMILAEHPEIVDELRRRFPRV